MEENIVELKKCACGCEKEFPATSFYWHKYSKSKDGFQCYSKECRKRLNAERAARLRITNPPRYNEGLFKECTKCLRNLEVTRENFAVDYKGEYGVRYWCTSCDRERDKKRTVENCKRNEKNRREKTFVEVKWCNACQFHNPTWNFGYDKSKTDGFAARCQDCNNARQSTRRTGNKGNHTTPDWVNLKLRYNNFCAYCDCNSAEEKDHFHPCTPLPGEKRGTDNIRNIIPACKSCNTSKNNSNPYEWIKSRFGNTHPLLDFEGETHDDILLL